MGSKSVTNRIETDKQITMHFTLSLEDGEVVDTTYEKQPVTFVVGDGNIPSGFENALKGLKEGDSRSILLSPEQSFGEYRDENVQKFRRDSFKRMVATEDELIPGLVVSFSDASDNELPGVIKGFEDQYVVVDFNHPLAGRSLNFQVEILSVTEPESPIKMLFTEPE